MGRSLLTGCYDGTWHGGCSTICFSCSLQVILYWDSLRLMEIATCFWSLANAKLINELLQSAASHMVVQKVGKSE